MYSDMEITSTEDIQPMDMKPFWDWGKEILHKGELWGFKSKAAFKLISKKKFDIAGKGTVYIIDTEQNKLPKKAKDFCPLLMYKIGTIDGWLFKITGIELVGDFENSERDHKQIGVLTKQVGVMHPLDYSKFKLPPPYNKGIFKF